MSKEKEGRKRIGAIRLNLEQGGGVILPDDDEAFEDAEFTKEQLAHFEEQGVFERPEPEATRGTDPRKLSVRRPASKKAAKKASKE